jgi:hypothetical protein
VRFLIAGMPPTSAAEERIDDNVLLGEQKQLEQEQLEHRDLVFQHGIREGYENLHIKVCAISFVTNCVVFFSGFPASTGSRHFARASSG